MLRTEENIKLTTLVFKNKIIDKRYIHMFYLLSINIHGSSNKYKLFIMTIVLWYWD